jgi:Methylamine utilisation protein MauE
MIDPLLGRLVAACLALLLSLAAWHKLGARVQFAAAVRGYRLLPGGLVGPVVVLLPLLEFALALAWLSGLARGVVAAATAGLLLLYAAAMTVNLWRGRVDIDCGCGLGGAGRDDGRLSWGLVARNVLLAAAAGVAALPVAQRDAGRMEPVVLVMAILAALLLYSAASQLLRNGAAMAAWRTPRD